MLKFQKLFSSTTKSLKERGISAKVLAQNLKCLGSLIPTFINNKQHQLVLRDKLPSVEDRQIDDAMHVVNDYCSFFNFHIIEHLIEELGVDQDKKNLAEYKVAFHEYAHKRHIFMCPSEIGTMTNDVTMYVTLDETHDKSTVSALHLFVSHLREILKIPPDAGLKLCRLEPGSIMLTFQLPLFLVQEIFPLSKEQETELSNDGVGNLWFFYQFRGHQKQVK